MIGSDVYWTVHHCDNWRIKDQLDATWYFIVLLIGSTRFGHYYAHHRELATMVLITTLVVSFFKDGGGSVTVNVWFLVVCVQFIRSYPPYRRPFLYPQPEVAPCRGDRDHWGDLDVDGRIILWWISRRWDVGIWTGLGWPRIETGGGRLWVR